MGWAESKGITVFVVVVYEIAKETEKFYNKEIRNGFFFIIFYFTDEGTHEVLSWKQWNDVINISLRWKLVLRLNFLAFPNTAKRKRQKIDCALTLNWLEKKTYQIVLRHLQFDKDHATRYVATSKTVERTWNLELRANRLQRHLACQIAINFHNGRCISSVTFLQFYLLFKLTDTDEIKGN